MNVGSSGGDEDEVVSAINTTPLVDVMLVLLIIFLITIPVVTHTIPVQPRKETNIPRQTKPENIDISVNKDGDIFWNQQLVADSDALFQRLSKVATMKPQPEVHIRGAGQGAGGGDDRHRLRRHRALERRDGARPRRARRAPGASRGRARPARSPHPAQQAGRIQVGGDG